MPKAHHRIFLLSLDKWNFVLVDPSWKHGRPKGGGSYSVISVNLTLEGSNPPHWETARVVSREFLSPFSGLWVLDIGTHSPMKTACSTNVFLTFIGDTLALSFSARVARTLSAPPNSSAFLPRKRRFCFWIPSTVRRCHRRFSTRHIGHSPCRQKRYLICHYDSLFFFCRK